MQVSVMTVVVALVSVAHAAAQEEPRSPRPLLRRDRVDFWGDRGRAEPAQERPGASGLESLWAEPTVGSDGRVSVYVPPKAVMEFLDRPTRENARRYAEWQSERLKRIKAAVEMLRQIQTEERAAHAKDEEPPQPASKLATRESLAGEILYFSQPGCSWCTKQDAALAELRGKSPDIAVVRVAPGDERWKTFAVSATPTLVVAPPGRPPRVVRGYVGSAELARILTETRHASR